MTLDSCYRAGYVIKKHGFGGELRVHFENAPPKKLDVMFLLIDGMLVPFFVDKLTVGESYAIVKLHEVNTEREAGRLNQKEIYLPNTLKPRQEKAAIDANSFVGFGVYRQSAFLGRVTGVQEHVLNPLLIVMRNEKELLIPINDHFITAIDSETRSIQVELPDGFLDI